MISMKFLDEGLKFRIGKHKDKHISDVDRFYLEWCVKEGREKMKPIEVDIFKAFIKHKKDYAERMESEKSSLSNGISGGAMSNVQEATETLKTYATAGSLLADCDEGELPF